MEDHQERDERAWPKALIEICDVLEALFKRCACEDPRQLAEKAAIELGWYSGGRQIYLPRGNRIRIALRDREIYRRVGKEKVRDLAVEYGLGEIHVYRIVRQQRALGLSKRGRIK